MKALPPVGRPNGGRLGKPKETTGCLTCKKRHIKCDEQKPFCNRCTSSGRQCAGYDSNSVRVLSQTTEWRAPPQSELLLSLAASTNEAQDRAFRYFVYGGAAVLAGDIDVELWSRLIPQRSHNDPSVRHSIIAIGSLLMRAHGLSLPGVGVATVGTTNPDGDQMAFALWHYSEAIKFTLQAFQETGGDSQLYGITCMLFFCIEALQGRETQALSLFQRGNSAHVSAIHNGKAGSSSGDLAAVFARMALQCGMFSGEPLLAQEAAGVKTVLPSSIASMAQARNELNDLISMALGVTNQVFLDKGRRLLQGETESEAADSALAHALTFLPEIQAGFDQWHLRFAPFHCTESSLSSQEAIAASILLIHHQAMKIYLRSAHGSEEIFDDYLPEFQHLLTTCAAVIGAWDQSSVKRAFTFEMGLIAPIYTAVAKCRHPMLRRQFLNLLKRAPAQEGLWSRSIMTQVGQRLIDLEEGGVVEFPPIERRFWLVEIGLRVTLDDGRYGDYVNFCAPPNASNGFSGVMREFFCA